MRSVFYDLAVYRRSEEKYHEQLDSFLDKGLFGKNPEYREEKEKSFTADPQRAAFIRDHYTQLYGGSWTFNETVGYLRLFFFGSDQIRGELWHIRAKRLVRTRRKVFEYTGASFGDQVYLRGRPRNEEIYQHVLEYVERAKTKLKPRIVDDSLFKELGRFVDWQALWSAHSAS